MLKKIDPWDALVVLSLFWLCYATFDFFGWKVGLTIFSSLVVLVAFIRAYNAQRVRVKRLQ